MNALLRELRLLVTDNCPACLGNYDPMQPMFSADLRLSVAKLRTRNKLLDSNNVLPQRCAGICTLDFTILNHNLAILSRIANNDFCAKQKIS